jgi:hypothetical protein
VLFNLSSTRSGIISCAVVKRRTPACPSTHNQLVSGAGFDSGMPAPGPWFNCDSRSSALETGMLSLLLIIKAKVSEGDCMSGTCAPLL